MKVTCLLQQKSSNLKGNLFKKMILNKQFMLARQIVVFTSLIVDPMQELLKNIDMYRSFLEKPENYQSSKTC